ncbi:haloacid dehalogenase [Trichoderma citrinoviride]|uniref:Haloacid dehalogenase n=1 Tax=Trichoderma citrinoviride TaxID=58853 RepID=A0A2T4BHH5_9HYPO|nr:haloacid dehalogenase [Trichoderma citrinoviride]PTB68699.1 haloacid dehalogenase [Trichoderma citrinoviride]
MPSKTSRLTGVKALLFDVFGTVVDWRSSVTDELSLRIFRKQQSSSGRSEEEASSSLSPALRTRLEALAQSDWDRFVQEWRDSYNAFTRAFDPATDEWKSIDEHHRESLVELLRRWDLEGLFTESEIRSLSLVWHRLAPWPDSAEGLERLHGRYTTATLSNANTSILRDLSDFGGLVFDKVFSAETFRAYKPDPGTYLGAVRGLGLRPEEVALVAAHMKDLRAARDLGLGTIYVERPAEEEWGREEERFLEARGWVDLWVAEGEGGLLGVAEKLRELEGVD